MSANVRAAMRRTIAGVGAALLVAAGLTVAGSVTALPSAAGADGTIAQQWVTAISATSGTGTNASRTLTFGATGVTATERTVATTGQACGMSGVIAFAGTNLASFVTPAVPAATPASAVTCLGIGPSATRGTRDFTITFDRPIAEPMIHVIGLDGSYLEITGVSTTGAPITVQRISGNNELESSGSRWNSVQVQAGQSGCETNAGANPNGACGSLRISAASGLIQQISLRNSAVSSTLSTSSDGWAYSLSIPDPTRCDGVVALQNRSFEQPVVTGATAVAESAVPGWETTAGDDAIEIWPAASNPAGTPAVDGTQFIELNAGQAGRTYQDVATEPGQTLRWSLKHRGRDGDDTMRVLIGAAGGTLTDVSGSLTDGAGAWGAHSGAYAVPTGQTSTRIAFESVQTSANDPVAGNLIDDVDFGTGPCLLPSKSVVNLSRAGATAEVGDTLRYTVAVRNDGGNASQQTISSDALPAGVVFVPGSIRIATGPGTGTSTDAAGDDRGEYAGDTRTVVVRLGAGATGTAGGDLVPGAITSYTFDVRVATDAAATTIGNAASVAFRDPVGNTDRVALSDRTQTPVGAAADLAVAKTLDTAPLVAGLPTTFTVTVTNNGPQTGTGVTLTDVIPAGLTNVQATPSGGTCTVGASIDCALPDLASGASTTVTVVGTVSPSLDPGSALTNTASVAGALTDPTPGNNTATVAGTVTTSADLVMTKSFSPATPVAGGSVTYALTVRNDGPSDARAVRITDPLDPASTFVSATPPQGTCAVAAQTLTCDLGTIGAGATVTVPLVVTLAPGGTAVVQNTASVSSSTSDPDPADNTSSTSFDPSRIADLGLTKTASATQAAAGETITYTLVATNAGASDAVNVVLADTLPQGFAVSAIDAGTATCTQPDGASVRCTWATLASGASGTVTVQATVAADAPAGLTTNTASVTSPVDDPNPANNASAVDVEIVQSADVSIVKTADAAAIPGAAFGYTLTTTNAGPSLARGVVVSDTLPSAFALGAVPDGCTVAGATVTCAFGDLAVGQDAAVRLDGTLAPGATGTLTNTASAASPTPDPDATNNASTVQRTLAPRADIVVEKTTSTPTVPLGGDAAFVITVRNDGPSVADAVVVDELAPSGLFVTTATPSVGVWSAGESRWFVGSVQPGGSASLAVTARATATGAQTNTASGTSSAIDPAPESNTGTATMTVTPSADLSIVKTSSADPGIANASLTFTLVVSNAGPSAAAAVTVVDQLPADLLDPTTPTPGCTIAGGELRCAGDSIPSGGTFTASVSGRIDPASAAATMTNTASVASTTPDPDPANNSSTVTIGLAGTPAVELIKVGAAPADANGTGRTDAGDTIDYTFTVRNTGAVTIASASITDALLGGAVTCTALGAPIAPGAEAVCAPVTYTLTQADVDAGTVHNEASVAAETPRGQAADAAEADVAVAGVDSIVLSKVAGALVDVDGDGQATPGDTIAYTFTATNSGTTTLQNVGIVDPMLGGAVDCAALDGVELAPGASAECAPVDHALVQGDIDAGIVRNTATVTADAAGRAVTDEGSASVDVDRTAGVELTKAAGQPVDATGDGRVGAGDTIPFSFTVRNTGTATLSAVAVTDPLLGAAAVCEAATLAPGATVDCAPTAYVLTQVDIDAGTVHNDASVAASSPVGAVADTAGADVDAVGVDEVAIEKSAAAAVDANGNGRRDAGDTIAYTFAVTNSGTTTLTAIAVEDPRLEGAVDCGTDTLAPARSTLCTGPAAVLTQAEIDARLIVNTASVSAQGFGADPVAASDTVDTALDVQPAVELEKTGEAVDSDGDGTFGVGDIVSFRFTVRNTGAVVLTDLTIVDPMLGGEVDCDLPALEPGAQTECGPIVYRLTAADVAAGEVVNVATVAGDAGLSVVSASGEATVDLRTLPATGATIVGGTLAILLLAGGGLLWAGAVRRRRMREV
ncbi:hypothetical protein [Microbacterium sp. NPDC089695]|uniref:DUF7507 domain-containing protein n=1 Tax=Microbacterium sp. NPDC089695 TaxID=3364198 RepID=UPI0037F1FB08